MASTGEWAWSLADWSDQDMKISEKYRNKGLAGEKLGKEAKDYGIKCAWAEIAIEWHSLANRIAQEVGQDCDTEVSLKAP